MSEPDAGPTGGPARSSWRGAVDGAVECAACEPDAWCDAAADAADADARGCATCAPLDDVDEAVVPGWGAWRPARSMSYIRRFRGSPRISHAALSRFISSASP